MKNTLLGFKIIAGVLVTIVTSWILIHILALFGVFLGFAYPLWWILSPRQTICLLCRAERNGAFCPFCRKQVDKTAGVTVQSLTSSILNGSLILIFSVLSLCVVFGESQLLNHFEIPPTAKTASFVIPPKGQYRLGEIFPMQIAIDNFKNPINAVQADIGFDPDKLEIESISTTQSFANIFIQKEINNHGGYARLTGGLPNPGFYGNHGIFGTIYFKGKQAGLATISFLPSSLVLANDGRGTNILKSLPSVSYLILPERISQDEETAQSQLIASLKFSTSPSNQMLFFDNSQILGVSTEKNQIKSNPDNFGNDVLEIMENFDNYTSSLWIGIFKR